MPRSFADVQDDLRAQPRRWLVTGAAGFIGSNLVQALLELGQDVVGFDNFATGHRRNLDDVLAQPGAERGMFSLVEGDIRDRAAVDAAMQGVHKVLHQAALGSVPRSLKDPMTSHTVNVDGTLNVFLAARDAEVERLVYASSSSVYGDHPGLPKVEDAIGNVLSPYAATKRTDEIYARVFHQTYGLPAVGLRYFNVFGRRQDPDGPYAAVMPKWIARLLKGEDCVIFGDGETSRDFCYIKNVVQANLLGAACADDATGEVYNIAYGERTTLNTLFELLRDGLRDLGHAPRQDEVVYQDFRPGDVRHSLADTSKAARMLGYAPEYSVRQGLDETLAWYVENAAASV